jgi:glycosyltransferase involved in cell wall biosynthesis
MRVLHLNAGNLFGGIEVNLLTLARFRAERPDVEMEYGACFDARPAEEMRKTGVRVHTFGAVRLSRPWTVLAVRRRLATLLRVVAYGAIVVHGSWPHLVFAPVVRRFRQPLVFWAHDRYGTDGGWLDRLARRTRPDRVICNSRYTEEAMPRYFPGVAAEVIYCPVAALPRTDGFDRLAVRRRFDTPADAVVVVQVGRWEPHKGHLAHMEALGKLKDVPGWVCWQVGAPQQASERAYQDEVRAAAERAGVADRVRFLDWQPDLGDVLGAADVYCQPNTRPEPFGIAVVEALYAGLPVVASAEGGPVEILTPECGVLVRPGDTGALAAALGELICDPNRRQALGASGPLRAVELCDPTAAVTRLALALERVGGVACERSNG